MTYVNFAEYETGWFETVKHFLEHFMKICIFTFQAYKSKHSD